MDHKLPCFKMSGGILEISSHKWLLEVLSLKENN